MKIGVASMGNPEAVETWSGTPSNIIFYLRERGHEVFPITLAVPKEPWHFNWLRRIHHRINKRWFMSSVEETYLRQVGKQLDEEVDRLNVDIVLVIHGDFLAYTTFTQPACIIHDTTFATLVDYYDSFTNLTKRSVKAGNIMYANALKRANVAVFSSSWASNSAINDYNTPKSKVFTVPLGANLNKVPDVLDVQHWIETRSKADTCMLLFLGAEWLRKGGNDALKVVLELNRLGIKSTLTIVGCSPEIPTELVRFVNIIGFLRKDVSAEARKLELLLQQSNVLIVPSIAECYGCVYCEANAYGLPVLARNTGGVGEIVKEGFNGLLLNPDESPEGFAKRWAEVWQQRSLYKQLSTNARNEYEERLNYNVFVTRLEEILFEVTQKENKETSYINLN